MDRSTIIFTGRPPADELAKLRGLVREADPRAIPVPTAVVRRAVRHSRHVSPFVLGTPHTECCVVDRSVLLEVVKPRELGFGPDTELPERLLLLALPEPEGPYLLADGPTRLLLWRRLFHARVHAVLEEEIATEGISRSALREMIHRIGQAEFDEVRAVLKQKDRVLPPGDDASVLVEFAAFYLELLRFAPRLLPLTFPTLPGPAAVTEVLSGHLDPDALASETRIRGAPDPAPPRPRVEAPRAPRPRPKPLRSFGRRRLLRRAHRARARGNHVRAAILAWRASDLARARREIDALLEGLARGSGFAEEDRPVWRAGLRRLLHQGAAGRRSRSTRVLFDLQKVLVDRERGINAVDPVEWALSLGRRPLRRPLRSAVLARTVHHLRQAQRRLAELEIAGSPSSGLRPPLERLLEPAEEAAEAAFRRRIREALAEVGLTPENLPERVAERKIVAELADRAVERGRLRLGDLRDALSRNPLKLSGMKLKGDPLLRLDRLLAVSLDGVYRRGEFYLRWLQRVSALALGTRAGAFLVRFAVLPFAGSFVVLEGLQHTVVPLLEELTGHRPHLATPLPTLMLGVFIFLLIHRAPFRRGVVKALRLAGRALWTALVVLPSWLFRRPVIARILQSRTAEAVERLVLRPALYAGVAFLVWVLFGGEASGKGRTGLGLFLGAVALTNLPAWRRAEDTLRSRIARQWRAIRITLFAGAIRLLLAVFRALLDVLDRLLHAVDEWLRFREGDPRSAVVLKAVLGPPWFLSSYVVRIYVNLLIEPQVNPVKHFPVVTVSHKVILPMSITLTRLFATPLAPLGPVASNGIAGATVFLLPGVFGFLVWELKENWRLFAGNRPETLRPAPVGHHGETVLRLLKPGFHSGTLPKLYRKLRRAEEIEVPEERRRRRGRLRHSLEETETAVRRFVEREFLALLLAQGRVGPAPRRAGRIAMGSNAIHVEIPDARGSAESFEIAFEEQSGRLVASVARQGWAADLDEEERAALHNALAGLYKLAGVELVREQIRAALGTAHRPYDIAGEDLVVWAGCGFTREIRYDLAARPLLRARARFGDCPRGLRELPAAKVVFRESPVTWKDWVAAFPAGEGPVPRLLPRVALLRSDR